MIGSLFIQEFKENYKLLLIFVGVIFMYSGVIVWMYDPNIQGVLTTFTEEMPELMNLFGMATFGDSLMAFLLSYLYGMILTIFPMVFEIMLCNKLIAGKIDNGSFSFHLSTPHSRFKIIFTEALFVLANVFLMILAYTIFTLVVSEIMFPSSLDIPTFLLANLGIFFLHIMFSGFGFLISCLSNELRFANIVSYSTLVGFYIIQMIGNLGDKTDFFKYITPYNLFSPAWVLNGNLGLLWQFSIAFISGITMFIVGIKLFTKRDLPI